ncbi:class I SAM-dependent methyltransferase [Desulfuribacillus alkaliarsenatis]|uniref:Methyltransferase type 11 domain-containing protein n=1 Tax=Desulfuribacillus alkaliarsenatis TaxID=766136 RepID=A0A1E5G145_9FIRM|nr:class I SAM-dependent methyltransferase [Desulfuribacillus alkaliarsenatis]OEF96628.1 hypothetical protein BHF68_08275 [Desulfuribacillus alkaliarsenatis]
MESNQVKEKYNKKAKSFDTMMAPMELMGMKKWRKALVAKAQGLVLEAGVGTGANLPYYPAGIKVVAVDFSSKMLDIAEVKVASSKAEIELKLADIQELPFEDDTFDTVITACVFCSVPDALQGFKELRRVTKATGNLYLLEHVRSENAALGKMMDWLNPLTVKHSGVNINRRTEATMETAGLEIKQIDKLFGDIVKLIHATPGK